MTRTEYRIRIAFGTFLLGVLSRESDLSWSGRQNKAVMEWLDYVENERAITRSMY